MEAFEVTFAWLAYVELASRLLRGRELDIEEAYLRASISRAYYGVFGVLWYRKGRKVPRSHGSKHQLLIMHLLNSPDTFDQILGSDLDRLRRLRNVADYETSAVVTLEEAENAYDLAASMGQRVQAL